MTSLRRSDIADALDVWLASPDAVRDADEARRCRDLLTPGEAAACDAFHDGADRRRALVARALVRTTLSRYADAPPRAWRFATGEHGRPEIAEPAGTRLRFNVSHTRRLVACAVTLDADVGVDVETTTPDADLPAVAETVFTPAEISAMRALAPERRVERFYTLWTLKEAYLKARGVGLSLSPLTLEFDVGTDGDVRARFAAETGDEPSGWWFAHLRADDDHLLAIALRRRGPAPRVRLFGVAPPDGRVEARELRLRASSPA